MRELSLFSGAGGGLLASRWILGWRTMGYVEFNAYCQRVIAQRIADGALDWAPTFGDVRAFVSEGYAHSYQGMVDVVSGGFPCQPFSLAGLQDAGEDPRDMWPATAAVLRIVRPRYAFLENVPGLLSSGQRYCGNCGHSAAVGRDDDPRAWCAWCGGLLEDPAGRFVDRYYGRILRDLAEIGFDAEWLVLGADDVGAPHIRKRLWIRAELADADSAREGAAPQKVHARQSESGGSGSPGGVPDAERDDLREQRERCGQQRGQQGPAEPRDHGADERLADAARVQHRRAEQRAERERTGPQGEPEPVPAVRRPSERVPMPSGPEAAGAHPDADGRRCGLERIEEHGDQQREGRHVAHGLREGRPRDRPDVENPAGRRRQQQRRQREEARGAGSRGEAVPHAEGDGREAEREPRRARAESPSAGRSGGPRGAGRVSGETFAPWWFAEPAVGRVAHGVADRVGQLGALGNGQVPGVAALAWQILTDMAQENR